MGPVDRIEIADLGRELLPEAVGVLARGMRDNPIHVAAYGDDAHLQGRGVGSALLAEHCRRLDEGDEVGYLETDKAENVRFYGRFGYRVVAERPVLGVRCWFMRRERRSAAARPAA